MLPQLGIYIAIFFGTIGTILVGVFSYICIRKWSTAEVPYEELVRWDAVTEADSEGVKKYYSIENTWSHIEQRCVVIRNSYQITYVDEKCL